MRKSGIYKSLGDINYFTPHSLPPFAPELDLNAELMSVYGEAVFALGQLNEMSLRLPDQHRFIKAYVIKEALLSSAIEGIHTTLMDVFECESNKSKPNKDTQLVLNYTKAVNTALNMMKEQNLPLVSRIILRAHEVLLSEGDEDNKTPGVYRKQSVRVGELVPPPAPEVLTLMGNLEKYINEPSDLPALIQAGLVHVQFETIHPFLDGNGRIGRLLIVLMLIDSGLLNLPILYPSYYFKKHHLEYYQRLNNVRTQGDYEGWVLYYLKAIADSAKDAHRRAKEIEALEAELKNKIQHDVNFVRIRETANSVLELLFSQPIIGITQISEKLKKAYNTISNVLKHFVELNIASEKLVSKRNKVYRFEPYLTLLEKNYDD